VTLRIERSFSFQEYDFSSVTPAKAGVHRNRLDARLRGHDG
jgi:hypothetical protein